MDYASECQRIWDEKVKADLIAESDRLRRVKYLSEHLFDKQFAFIDAVDALNDADQENAARFMQLLRSDDDTEFGRLVKAMVHAYSWRVAEIKV